MNIINHIKKLDFKLILIISALMGLSGGYHIISSGHPFYAKILFSIYGLLIGIPIGLILTELINRWQVSTKEKKQILFCYFLLTIAPTCWAFFDFEEHIQSKKGLVIMLMLDLIAISIMTFILKEKLRRIIPNFIVIPLWQIISLYWFICLTWQEMNYWD